MVVDEKLLLYNVCIEVPRGWGGSLVVGCMSAMARAFGSGSMHAHQWATDSCRRYLSLPVHELPHRRLTSPSLPRLLYDRIDGVAARPYKLITEPAGCQKIMAAGRLTDRWPSANWANLLPSFPSRNIVFRHLGDAKLVCG